MLTYTLFYFIAELFPVLYKCWSVSCFIKLPRYSQSWDIADVYSVLLHCWAIPNLITPLRYILSSYIAELLKQTEKGQICHFHGVKWTKTWLFGLGHFFTFWHVEKFLVQNLARCVSFNPKSKVFVFQSKIWCDVKFLNRNLTRCEYFVSKSCKFWTFPPKSDFHLVFQVLTEW